MNPTKFAALISLMGKQIGSIEPIIPGGMPKYTWDDVSGALAGANSLGAHLVLAKYANDQSSAIHATAELYQWAYDRDWPNKLKVQQAQLMCTQAVKVAIDPQETNCKSCQGRKERTFNKLTQPCKKCDGTGKMKLKQRHIARQSGIIWDDFRNNRHAEFFNNLLEKLDSVESLALDHGARRMREVA